MSTLYHVSLLILTFGLKFVQIGIFLCKENCYHYLWTTLYMFCVIKATTWQITNWNTWYTTIHHYLFSLLFTSVLFEATYCIVLSLPSCFAKFIREEIISHTYEEGLSKFFGFTFWYSMYPIALFLLVSFVAPPAVGKQFIPYIVFHLAWYCVLRWNLDIMFTNIVVIFTNFDKDAALPCIILHN